MNAAPRGSFNLVFLAGTLVGILGGLVGLGGAEFRLPLLIGLFGFVALEAVILNKAMSLIVVLVAIPSRLLAVPLVELANHWSIVMNLLAGSLAGAWFGASWATKIRTATLYRVLALLLVGIAIIFGADHLYPIGAVNLNPVPLIIAGVIAGFGIGVVAAIMGVAGGELLIPTITILYNVDVKLAGSLSLLVSLPTMLIAFTRYSRSQAFAVLGSNARFVFAMATGSVLGTVAGGLLVGYFPTALLIPLIVVLLLISAWKVWRHA